MTAGQGEIEVFSAEQAAIQPYTQAGIIERAIGPAQPNMEGIVSQHLGDVAMLNARGDTVPERPTYVLNPDTGLLINYAYRRNLNPDREGFFADVVQLDATGMPRHGISAEAFNPFASPNFINVAVGENDRGFAPSSVTINFDKEDPDAVVPPNVDMADLLGMLRQGVDAIPVDLTFEDYMDQQKADQEEMRGRVQERQGRNYPGTLQAMTPDTDAGIHLIVSDREDASGLAAASREAGVFPIVVSAQEIVRAGFALMADSKRFGLSDDEFRSFHAFLDISRRDGIRGALTVAIPAFVTIDFDGEKTWEMDQEEAVQVPPGEYGTGYKGRLWQTTENLLRCGSGFYINDPEGPLSVAPIFSRFINHRYPADYSDPEYPEVVGKNDHGNYWMGLDPQIPENMQTYTDWIRKVRLDFMMTKYLRGLNQL